MKTISPIQVLPQTRYFVDKNGLPAFWLGDTEWELFRLFDADIALRILRRRQAQGFNVILIMLTGVNTGIFAHTQEAPYTNLHGEQPWIDNDPLKPNEKYFQHVDTIIRLGELTGQTFVVGVYHQWHKDTIPVEKARFWARWVAQRYRDVPNLIWSMYPKATTEYISVCRELAAGLQEGDGGAHLISMHPDPSVASSSFMHTEPWLAFNMIQTCIDYDQIVPAVTADYQRKPIKPVVMAEGGYEGVEFDKLQTPHHIRKQAYWTQLAGGHHVYGHNDHWRFPHKWQNWLFAPGGEHLRVFREVITTRDRWWEMVPDQSLLNSGAGNGYSLNAAARSATGHWIMVYMSEPATISLRLDAITAGKHARASWINPINGDCTPAGIFTASEQPAFTPPVNWEDGLLLVEADG